MNRALVIALALGVVAYAITRAPDRVPTPIPGSQMTIAPANAAVFAQDGIITTPDFEQEVEQLRRYQLYYPMRSKPFDNFMVDYLAPNWA